MIEIDIWKKSTDVPNIGWGIVAVDKAGREHRLFRGEDEKFYFEDERISQKPVEFVIQKWRYAGQVMIFGTVEIKDSLTNAEAELPRGAVICEVTKGTGTVVIHYISTSIEATDVRKFMLVRAGVKWQYKPGKYLGQVPFSTGRAWPEPLYIYEVY